MTLRAKAHIFITKVHKVNLSVLLQTVLATRQLFFFTFTEDYICSVQRYSRLACTEWWITLYFRRAHIFWDMCLVLFVSEYQWCHFFPVLFWIFLLPIGTRNCRCRQRFFSELNKHFQPVWSLVSGFKFKLVLMLSICLPTLNNRDFL